MLVRSGKGPFRDDSVVVVVVASDHDNDDEGRLRQALVPSPRMSPGPDVAHRYSRDALSSVFNGASLNRTHIMVNIVRPLLLLLMLLLMLSLSTIEGLPEPYLDVNSINWL
jgi:hypothetical protein